MAQEQYRTLKPENRLLTVLPSQDLGRLWPLFEPVKLDRHHVLLSPEQRVASIYFPQSGLVSMLTRLADGRSAEVGVVGSEGLVGLPLVLGSDTSSVEGVVQVPGTMLRLGADALRQALEDTPALKRLLLRYVLAFHQQVTQTAACNANHALDQRLARWLLMAHDRSGGDNLPLTQEQLALMLCVHRPGVTVAARVFQKAGLIHYDRGNIAITDRAGLEATACECYASVRQRFKPLQGALKA